MGRKKKKIKAEPLEPEREQKIIEAIRGLIPFFEGYLEEMNSKLIDYSMLKCVLMLEEGRDLWGYFCTLINFQISVNKFLIPMGAAIADAIKKTCDGSFIKFVLATGEEQRELLETLEWAYTNAKGESVAVSGWRHRFFKVDDACCILTKFRNLIARKGGFTECIEGMYRDAPSFQAFLIQFVKTFHDDSLCEGCGACKSVDEREKRTVKLFSKAELGHSSCFKRYLLFLRWMSRKEHVGTWDFIACNELMMPVDVWIKRIFCRIGVIHRKGECTWKDVEEITAFLRKVDADDPMKYDLYIYELGTRGICDKDVTKCKCGACPLNSVCTIPETG